MATFLELGVQKSFIKSINEIGIKNPTPIQEEVIPILIEQNTDLVGQAQTGTGKTAAYGLPLLHKIDSKKKEIQGLILCPTRELGQQIAKQLFKFTKYTDKIFTEAVYGGAKIDDQITRLTRPTHIVVATPGRLIDLIKRKALNLDNVHTLILDEADEMLTMGFKKELDTILSKLSFVRNRWMFSATMPTGIREIANKYMAEEAIKIQTDKRNVVNKNIEHQFLICDESDKLHILSNFLKTQKKQKGVIFCKTKNAAKTLEKQLIAKNFETAAIHGDLLQKERDKVMRAFKNETIKILIATDIAARGLDIPSLNYVVHYQQPDKDEFYTHRSGRTARAGKTGISLSLATTLELKKIRQYEKNLSITFTQIR